jgi:hypothetical protein
VLDRALGPTGGAARFRRNAFASSSGSPTSRAASSLLTAILSVSPTETPASAMIAFCTPRTAPPPIRTIEPR